MKKTKVLYEELLPNEFLERLNQCPIAYLPLGTLEWHGYHLPLGSDGLQSKGFFTLLAEKIGGIVLPMLFLGPDKQMSKDGFDYIGMDINSFTEGHPQQLEGSAYHVEGELFFQIVEATLRNLARAGFKIVVAHGHGPSTNAFRDAVDKWEKEFDLKLFDLWTIGGKDNDGIMTDHAAYNETSLVMGLYPELVNLDKIADDSAMVGIWGDDPRSTSVQTGKHIIGHNLSLVGKRLLEELSNLMWERREMEYKHSVKMF